MKTTDETGPIYGVPLIDKLPLGGGLMLQEMPNRKDLERVRKFASERTVAGYEVLLEHYRKQCDENEQIKEAIREIISFGNYSETILKKAIGDL